MSNFGYFINACVRVCVNRAIRVWWSSHSSADSLQQIPEEAAGERQGMGFVFMESFVIILKGFIHILQRQ